MEETEQQATEDSREGRSRGRHLTPGVEGRLGTGKGSLTEAILELSLDESADANQADRAKKASQEERIKSKGHEKALGELAHLYRS